MTWKPAWNQIVHLNGYLYVTGIMERDDIDEQDKKDRKSMYRYSLESKSWEEMVGPYMPRKFSTVVTASSRMFIIGGIYEGRGNGIVETFDTVTKQWSTVWPNHRDLHSCKACVANQIIYFFGGIDEEGDERIYEVDTYDVQTNLWNSVYFEEREDLPEGQVEGAFLINGLIYIIGAKFDGYYTGIFDPLAETLRRGEEVEIIIQDINTEVFALGSDIYVQSNGSDVPFQVYNVLSGQWRQEERSTDRNMNMFVTVPSSSHTSVAGPVLYEPEKDENFMTTPLTMDKITYTTDGSTLIQYDPETNTHTEKKTALFIHRSRMSIVTKAPLLFIIGGLLSDGRVTGLVEVYDVRKGTGYLLPSVSSIFKIDVACLVKNKLFVFTVAHIHTFNLDDGQRGEWVAHSVRLPYRLERSTSAVYDEVSNQIFIKSSRGRHMTMSLNTDKICYEIRHQDVDL
jgi:N-acetylneuraminic acid mutarotase